MGLRRIFCSVTMLMVFAAAVGCSTRAQQLRSQPLNTTFSVANNEQTTKKFLIYPAEDLRGGVYGLLYPTTLIPGINFFHMGDSKNFPETSGMLRSGMAVTVGSLPSAFPYLLAEMMRTTRFTPNATPIDQTNTKVKLRSFNYVIMGKILKSEFERHINIIPLAVLGIVGAPYIFVKGEVTFEISLYRTRNMNKPLFTKKYTHTDSKAVGLYYNHNACFDIFIEALESKLVEVVKDLAAAVK